MNGGGGCRCLYGTVISLGFVKARVAQEPTPHMNSGAPTGSISSDMKPRGVSGRAPHRRSCGKGSHCDSLDTRRFLRVSRPGH